MRLEGNILQEVWRKLNREVWGTCDSGTLEMCLKFSMIIKRNIEAYLICIQMLDKL